MCDWCEGKERISIGNNVYISIAKNELFIEAEIPYDYTSAGTKIDFCPNCGQPLAEPKPLTLEELKQREGKPVWITCLPEKIGGFWGVVIDYPLGKRIVNPIDSWDIYDEDNYGKTWVAYDYEPHEVK